MRQKSKLQCFTEWGGDNDEDENEAEVQTAMVSFLGW